MTVVIGLTGGIASGKSTVSTMFIDLDIPVIDADRIAREVVEVGQHAYEEIVTHFGQAILQPDGAIDRKKLGEIVFNDDGELQVLNSIVHPEIRKKMIQQRDAYKKEQKACVVLDIPLLFENDLAYLVDFTLVVYVSETIQLERLMKREGFSKDEATRRIQLQMPLEQKKKLADYVIDNNGTEDDTYRQLKQFLQGKELFLQKNLP